MENKKKKVAFVTGGNTGIGFGIASALLAQGYLVAITSRSQDRLEEAIGKLRTSENENVIGFVVDVRDYTQQEQAVQAILQKWGQLDVVIANAGIGIFGPIDELSIESWQETIDTNLTGPFYTVKASVEALKKSSGYFITISSLAGCNFFAGGSAYNASKFGLTGFTQAVMLDLRNYGVKVSTIMPGSVATSFNNNQVDEKDAWKIQKEDIGQLVVDLLNMNPRSLPSKIEIRPAQVAKP